MGVLRHRCRLPPRSGAMRWIALVALLLHITSSLAIMCHVFNSNDDQWRKVNCNGTPSQQLCMSMVCPNHVSGVLEKVGMCTTKTNCEVAKVNGKCQNVQCCNTDYCNSLPSWASDVTPQEDMWYHPYN